MHLRKSASRSKAETKWARDLSYIISEAEWEERWLALHKAPTSGRVRSLLWAIPTLRNIITAIIYAPFVPATEKPLFICSPTAISPIISGSRQKTWRPGWVSLSLPPGPQFRVIGVTPSAALCQSVITRLSLHADCNPPTRRTVGRWIIETCTALRGITMSAIWHLRCDKLLGPAQLVAADRGADAIIQRDIKASRLRVESILSTPHSTSVQRKAFLAAVWTTF
jgi:hypothetical protein